MCILTKHLDINCSVRFFFLQNKFHSHCFPSSFLRWMCGWKTENFISHTIAIVSIRNFLVFYPLKLNWFYYSFSFNHRSWCSFWNKLENGKQWNNWLKRNEIVPFFHICTKHYWITIHSSNRCEENILATLKIVDSIRFPFQ